ncbi:MAG TPA: hypothetical protein QKA14_01110 [Candidatus Megaira endosymbiont of Hartmannula sinica]|nr:hypothetical protein [Candidatus Megaera endosymbiont of Hartmannula sinica]
MNMNNYLSKSISLLIISLVLLLGLKVIFLTNRISNSNIFHNASSSVIDVAYADSDNYEYNTDGGKIIENDQGYNANYDNNSNSLNKNNQKNKNSYNNDMGFDFDNDKGTSPISSKPEPDNKIIVKDDCYNNKDIYNKDYTREEAILIKKISKRKQDIEKINQNLVNKENMLKIAEDKLNKKAQQMQDMQDKLNEIADQYNYQKDQRILNLVKIYESMRPRDAASIFNDLDEDILLKVALGMKPSKIASIMSYMDTTKAKNLSLDMVKIRSH